MFLKSKAAGCGSISTVISSIVLLCVSSVNNNNNNNLFGFHVRSKMVLLPNYNIKKKKMYFIKI